MTVNQSSHSAVGMSASERFEPLRRLEVRGGWNNEGMILMSDKLSGELAVLKRAKVSSIDDRNEVEKLYRVKGHPNISEILAHVPASLDQVKGKEPSRISNRYEVYCPFEKMHLPMHDQIFMKYYVAKVGTVEVHTLADILQNKGNRVPEGFAWAVLIGLLKALCFLHFGSVDVMREQSDENWEPILHRDLQMDNVFVHGGQAGYPDIVLGDFGSSRTEAQLRTQCPQLSAKEFEGWKALFPSDVKGLRDIMYIILHDDNEWGGGGVLGSQTWRSEWSDQLRDIVLPLNDLKNVDPRLLEYTRLIIRMHDKLLESGVVRFEKL